MRRQTILSISLAMILAFTSSLSAIPARPLPLTAEQYKGIQAVQDQPIHAASRDLQASYSSDRQQQLDEKRMANDVSTGVVQVGLPALLVAILISAAPL